VLATGEPLYVEDASASSAVSQVLVARFDVGSLLYQPVMRDGETIAVLALGWREVRRDPAERIAAARSCWPPTSRSGCAAPSTWRRWRRRRRSTPRPAC
jgi:hypothetical protein